MDVFVGPTVQAGDNANSCLADRHFAGFGKCGESHAGSLVGNRWADGAVADLGFDSGLTAGSSFCERARRIGIKGYLT